MPVPYSHENTVFHKPSVTFGQGQVPHLRMHDFAEQLLSNIQETGECFL